MSKKMCKRGGMALLLLPLVAMLLLGVSSEAVAQTLYLDSSYLNGAVAEDTVVYEAAEEMPEFPGGAAALNRFRNTNIGYPVEAMEKRIQGKVIVRFVVKKDGSIGKCEVLQGVHPLLDNEAIRLVKLLPKFKPGTIGGKPVNVWYTMPPVNFRLMNSSEPNDTIMPEFPGGEVGLRNYIKENLNFPREANNQGIEEKVLVYFKVKKDGSIGDVKIVKGLNPFLVAEAERFVKSFPKFKPGTVKGKAKDIWIKITLEFSFRYFMELHGGTMPEFPGGEGAMLDCIKKNLKYPQDAIDYGIQGDVELNFVVQKDGSISDIGIVKGVHPLLAAEAKRIVGSFPKFNPAILNGEPIAVRYTVTIPFVIDDVKEKSSSKAELPSSSEIKPQDFKDYNGTKEVSSDVEGKFDNNDPKKVYTKTEKMPKFPGGDEALMKFLNDNINYPTEAMKNGIQGRVIVQFVVTKDGSIGEVKIIRSIDYLLDKEAIRLVKLLPKFEPGAINGEPVNVWYTLPISFHLHTQDKSKEGFAAIERMPQFPGGEKALMKFVNENLSYPTEAMEYGIQGRVIVKFEVAKDGSIGKVDVLRKVDPLLDKEAIRVVKLLPKFEPATMGGMPVTVWMSLPITFGLKGVN